MSAANDSPSTQPLRRSREEAEALFFGNIGLVPYAIRRYTALRIDEDLMQEGYVALWRAAQLYDEKSGTLFPTYAVRAIQNRLYNSEKRKLRSVQPALSLDQMVYGEGRSPTLSDRMKDPGSEEPMRKIELEDWIDRNLTEEEKVVLRKRMTGMGAKKIAEIFGRSEPWGALRIKRIKEKLKRRNE